LGATIASKVDAGVRNERNEISQKLVQIARSVGQVGSKSTDENRELLSSIAKQLAPYSDEKPARIPISGVHDLIYSASPGGSSGTIGPFVGKVTQKFIDDTTFQNIVELGPLKVVLTAERRVLDDVRIRVKFIETSVDIFGFEIIRKETKGQGVWNHLFVGAVENDRGEKTLLRVLETPSLFVIEQKIK